MRKWKLTLSSYKKEHNFSSGHIFYEIGAGFNDEDFKAQITLQFTNHHNEAILHPLDEHEYYRFLKKEIEDKMIELAISDERINEEFTNRLKQIVEVRMARNFQMWKSLWFDTKNIKNRH